MTAQTPGFNALLEADRDHVVHSVVSWLGHERRGATILASAQGAFVTDQKGHTLLDGFSGLWCVNLGYGHNSIAEAAREQMARLPYATSFFHYSNEPAIRLAAKLANRAPGALDHVFFTLGGSDAIDSAVRLICYYFSLTGRPAKRHMIALDRGYHGSSAIGAGLTGLPAFHTNFGAPTTFQHHIFTPYPYRSAATDDDALIAASLEALRAKVAELGADNVAAFFAEPVIGSGGVIVPPTGWLKAMRELCRELDILFVADEVITGFGRTGPLFGCEFDGVEPDLMILAKGLTSGYCPMGALLISESIYRAIADHAGEDSIVGHGFTYSGHPVSAAVALEALRLYEEGGYLANGRAVGAEFASKLRGMAGHELVGDVRVRGMLAGVELVADKESKARFPAAIRFAELIGRIGYNRGLIFRAFADGTIGFAPPLCCSHEEIDLLIERFSATLEDVLQSREVREAMAAARRSSRR